MRLVSFRSRFSMLLIGILLSLTPGIAIAQLLLPPMGYLGIAPWVNGVSTPPVTILVKLNEPASINDEWPDNTWYNQWKLVPFDSPISSYDYISGVVMGELGFTSIDPTWPIDWPYHGWDWHDETVKALSIAVRSFGSYRAKLRDAGSGNKGIYGNTSDQVFRPFYKDMTTTLKQRYRNYRNLINMYTGIYLAYSSTSPQRHKVNLIEAQHASGNAVPTLSFW